MKNNKKNFKSYLVERLPLDKKESNGKLSWIDMKGYLLEESEAKEMGAPTPVPCILK